VSKEATPMLTLEILIPTAWFATVAFVVALCAISARSDRESGRRSGRVNWISVGALGLRGGAGEIRASGGSSWGETPEMHVRDISGV
jgi:hypothetical protein